MDSPHMEFGVEHLHPFSGTSTGTQHAVLAHQVWTLSQVLSNKKTEELGRLGVIHVDSYWFTKMCILLSEKCIWYWNPENDSHRPWGHLFLGKISTSLTREACFKKEPWLTLEIKLMETYSIMLLIACASTLHSILMKWHPPNYNF